MKFNITHFHKESVFDRQERITWWSQDKLRRALVVVVGAGATGNEAAKNLALLGVGRILICDMDRIEASNLSRTTLFRKEDLGKPKAEIAAERLRDLSLEDTARIDSFDGDITSELGAGVYRRASIVLGCLDNVDARLVVNAMARQCRVPWIDVGINQLDSSMTFYGTDGACYECYQSTHDSRRFSCSDFKRRVYAENRVATVQVSSALVAAIQVQEAIKWLCGMNTALGCSVSFRGTVLGMWSDRGISERNSEMNRPLNPLQVYTLVEDHECIAHTTPFIDVIETPLTAKNTLAELFDYCRSLGLTGVHSLDMTGERRSFITSVTCTRCGLDTEVLRPKREIFDDELRCQHCNSRANHLLVQETSEFSELGNQALLSRTLQSLGVPPLHVVSVRGENCETYALELTGDLSEVMPECSTWSPT